jgi:hypothetical protein
MKKLLVFVVLAMFALSFTVHEVSSEKAPIPASWSFTIKWDPSGCTSCGTIIAKRLTYSITNTEADPIPCTVDEGTDVSVSNTEFSNIGNNDCLDVDCRDCYYVEATIKYYDSNGLCCSATATTTWSGTELNDGTAELLIEM